MIQRPLPLLILAALAAQVTVPAPAQQDPFAGGGAVTVEVTPAPAEQPAPAAAPAPATAGAAATPAVPAKPPEVTLLESIKKVTFSRIPQVILDESAATLLPPPAPKPPPVSATPPATPVPVDPHVEAVAGLRRSVATGRWTEVGAFFADKFKDQPDPARQAWLHILDGLGQDPRQQGGQRWR